MRNIPGSALPCAPSPCAPEPCTAPPRARLHAWRRPSPRPAETLEPWVSNLLAVPAGTLHSSAPPATRAPMPLVVVTSASPSAKASPTASPSPPPSSSAASCSSIPPSSFVGSTTTRVTPAEVLLQNLLP
ncbi:unnamed protein product [Closterium sp. NIES-54]